MLSDANANSYTDAEIRDGCIEIVFDEGIVTCAESLSRCRCRRSLTSKAVGIMSTGRV